MEYTWKLLIGLGKLPMSFQRQPRPHHLTKYVNSTTIQIDVDVKM